VLLPNYSLENGDTGITRSGLAEISTAQAFSGTYSGLLRLRKNVFGQSDGVSQIEWDAVDIDAAETYRLFYFYHADEATSTASDLVLEVKYTLAPGAWVEVARITQAAKGVDWTSDGPYTPSPTGSIARVRFRVEEAGAVSVINDRWYVDFVYLSVEGDMAVRKWSAIAALKTQFKKILGSGAGYRTDLGSRVYDRLTTPEDGAEIPRPYMCMPLLNEEQTYEHEEYSITTEWRHRIHLFVDELNPTKTQTSAATLLADAHDDLVKALMEDFTLGGTVNDLTIEGSNTFCAALEDDSYGELVMDLRLKQIFQRSDLGV